MVAVVVVVVVVVAMVLTPLGSWPRCGIAPVALNTMLGACQLLELLAKQALTSLPPLGQYSQVLPEVTIWVLPVTPMVLPR